jgi:hypothetical protein
MASNTDSLKSDIGRLQALVIGSVLSLERTHLRQAGEGGC